MSRIIIIGAGPAGLATAYRLKQLGLDFSVLEQFDVGASWARYYDALNLHTRKPNVALPGLPLPHDVPVFPSGRDYLAYLQAYARHFSLPIRSNVTVQAASYRHGWHLTTSAGELKADVLIVASGIFNHPKRPQLPGEETFAGTVLHAQQYRCAQPYQGKRVLVVGAGNTGTGIALDLVAAGIPVGLAIRSGVQLVPRPSAAWRTRLKAWAVHHLPKSLMNELLSLVRKDAAAFGLPAPNQPPSEITPVVGFELAHAVKLNHIQLHAGLVSLAADTACFADGQEQAYDVVILATGYAPAIAFLDSSLSLNNLGQVIDAPPGLYTIGFYYDKNEPFLLSLRRESKVLAKKIQAQLVAETRFTPQKWLNPSGD